MRVIILCGTPGSGKSTYCKEKLSSYTRISQDDLGSKDACIKAFVEALDQKKDVVIDRCNHSVAQRKVWLNIALQRGVNDISCVYLVVSENEALARVLSRKTHPTISEQMPLEKKMSIVNFFSKELYNEPPGLDEGFSSVLFLRN